MVGGILSCAGKLVHRNAEMTQERRQFVFLPCPFLFLFALANSGARGLGDFVRRNSQILKNVIQDAPLVVRENIKNIAAVDHAAALRPGTVHRPLEKLGRFRRDPKALAGMLSAGLHPLFDQQLDRTRIDRKIPHRRSEKVVLFVRDSMQNMLDGNVILIALLRLVQGRFQDTLRPLSLNLSLYASISAIILRKTTGDLDAETGAIGYPISIITFRSCLKKIFLSTC